MAKARTPMTGDFVYIVFLREIKKKKVFNLEILTSYAVVKGLI